MGKLTIQSITISTTQQMANFAVTKIKQWPPYNYSLFMVYYVLKLLNDPHKP